MKLLSFGECGFRFAGLTGYAREERRREKLLNASEHRIGHGSPPQRMHTVPCCGLHVASPPCGVPRSTTIGAGVQFSGVLLKVDDWFAAVGRGRPSQDHSTRVWLTSSLIDGLGPDLQVAPRHATAWDESGILVAEYVHVVDVLLAREHG